MRTNSTHSSIRIRHGAARSEQLAQGIGTRTDSCLVRPRYQGIAFLPQQLIGHLAPEGMHHGTVRLLPRLGRIRRRADQHGAIGAGRCRHSHFLQNGLQANPLAGGEAGKKVIEGQHGVRLAATEVGL